MTNENTECPLHKDLTYSANKHKVLIMSTKRKTIPVQITQLKRQKSTERVMENNKLQSILSPQLSHALNDIAVLLGPRNKSLWSTRLV